MKGLYKINLTERKLSFLELIREIYILGMQENTLLSLEFHQTDFRRYDISFHSFCKSVSLMYILHSMSSIVKT